MLSSVLVSLQSQVSCHGAAFEGYSAAITSNSFGGNVIDMLDMDDVTQYMESMGIATHHKLLLKATFASWKKNPNTAFEALAAAKVARSTHVRMLHVSFDCRQLLPRRKRRMTLPPRRRRCVAGITL